LNIQENKQGKINLIEHNEQREENKIYDVQFKINDFAKYKNLYNFTKTLQDININSKWKK
jgi:5-hydroxyisourate hydrolase-like protein (transthyretin family)